MDDLEIMLFTVWGVRTEKNIFTRGIRNLLGYLESRGATLRRNRLYTFSQRIEHI